MICPKIFLLFGYVHFFFIDFSCYLFVGFLGSVCKFFGEGAKCINLRARIKILFVNIYTSIFFFKGWGGGGGVWGHGPPQPFSSSVPDFNLRGCVYAVSLQY